MITRAEAKALADAYISDQRKAQIQAQFHQHITNEATLGKYETNVDHITSTFTQNEKNWANQMLMDEPQLFSVSDFIDGNEHVVIWI